jgi:hypothetical protein
VVVAWRQQTVRRHSGVTKTRWTLNADGWWQPGNRTDLPVHGHHWQNLGRHLAFKVLTR